MEYNRACMLKPKDDEELSCVSSIAFNNAQKLQEMVNRQMGKKKSIKERRKSQINHSIDKEESEASKLSSHSLHQISHYNVKPKSLEYQLQIYKQKKKIAPNTSFEEMTEMPQSCFIRANYQNGSEFSPIISTSTSSTPKKHYLGNQLVLFRHKYSSSSKNSTPRNMSSSLSSSREQIKKSILRKPIYNPFTPIASKKMFSYTSSLINNITNQANEELDNFKKDIIRNGLSTSSLSFSASAKKQKNSFKSNSQVSLEEIRKKYHLDDLKSAKIDQLQLIKQNYDKVKQSLDDKCRSYLKQVINQVVYEDSQLNKPTVCDYSSYHMNQFLKQKEEFAKVGNEMLMIKKAIRGKSAIEPSDDRKTFKKMVKGIVEDDVDDLIKKKNVFRFNQKNMIPNKGRRGSIHKANII